MGTHGWIKRVMRGDDGQSLVIVMLSLVLVIAVAALAIDVSNWYQRHHAAQVAADAAALAAANCEATGSCNDTTATQTATSYVQTNAGVSIPSSNVVIANKTVTVTTPVPAHSFFAGLISGFFSSLTASATAKATWNTYGSNCATQNVRCAFIFANDTSCSGTNGATISINGTGNSSAGITGTVLSNSNISASGTGQPNFNVDAEYSDGAGCTASTSGHASYASTGQYQVPPQAPDDWPIDYRKLFTACSPSATYQCTGPGGTPSYCNHSSATMSVLTVTGSGVWCAVGTGTAGDPTTWNGTVLYNGTGSSVTLLGGTVIMNAGNSSPTAYMNGLLAWGTGGADTMSATYNTCPTSSPDNAVCLTGSGNGTISGAIFASDGGAYVNLGGTEGYSGFIEAMDVNYSSHGTVQATGPSSTPGSGPPQPPVDALIG